MAGFHKPGPGALILHQAVLYVILVAQKIHTDMVSNLPHIECILISDPTQKFDSTLLAKFGTTAAIVIPILWNLPDLLREYYLKWERLYQLYRDRRDNGVGHIPRTSS